MAGPVNQLANCVAWDAHEVARIVRWWLSSSVGRKQRAMAVGGFGEVLQQVYVDLLSYPPKDGYALTTIVCQRTTWTLYLMFSKIRRVKTVGKCRGIADHAETGSAIESCEKTRFVWQTLRRLLDGRTAYVICQRLEGAATSEIAARLEVHPQTIYDIFWRGIDRIRDSPAAEQLRQEVLF